MTAVATDEPTLQELLEQVESDPELETVEMKAEALVSYIPDQLVREVLTLLAERLLAIRQQRGGRVVEDARSPLDERPVAKRPYQPQVNTASGRSRRVGSSAHASPKIALATRTWIDLLATAVAIPGTDSKIEIRDMSAAQLHSLADSLYDTHERLHRLAEHVSLNGVTCARDLTPAALEACTAEELAA